MRAFARTRKERGRRRRNNNQKELGPKSNIEVLYDWIKQFMMTIILVVGFNGTAEDQMRARKKLRLHCHSILVTITKVSPLPHWDTIALLLNRYFRGKSILSGKWPGFLLSFKEAYLGMFGGNNVPWMTRIKYCAEGPKNVVKVICKLCGGIWENKDHVYRAMCIWEVLVIVGLATFANTQRLELSTILPQYQFLLLDNLDWKKFLIEFTIRMYYYKLTGWLASFERCHAIGDVFWKIQLRVKGKSSVPDGLTEADEIKLPSLKLCLITLNQLMPHECFMFCEDELNFARGLIAWEARVTGYLLASFRRFPILPFDEIVDFSHFATTCPPPAVTCVREDESSQSPLPLTERGYEQHPETPGRHCNSSCPLPLADGCEQGPETCPLPLAGEYEQHPETPGRHCNSTCPLPERGYEHPVTPGNASSTSLDSYGLTDTTDTPSTGGRSGSLKKETHQSPPTGCQSPGGTFRHEPYFRE